MKISNEKAIALFTALDYKMADKWCDNAGSPRMVKKIKQLAELVTEENVAKLDATNAQTLTDLLEAVEKGEDIMVGDAGPKPKKKGKVVMKTETKKSPKKSESKKGGKKVAKKTSPKAPAVAADLDKWGARKGTKTANFNAALTKKAKTMKELIDEAGSDQVMYNHANKLIEQGVIVKTDDGYKLKA